MLIFYRFFKSHYSSLGQVSRSELEGVVNAGFLGQRLSFRVLELELWCVNAS